MHLQAPGQGDESFLSLSSRFPRVLAAWCHIPGQPEARNFLSAKPEPAGIPCKRALMSSARTRTYRAEHRAVHGVRSSRERLHSIQAKAVVVLDRLHVGCAEAEAVLGRGFRLYATFSVSYHG